MSEATIEFIDEVCGIYFRSILLKNRGDEVTQHKHDYDHATFVGSGAVVAFVGEAVEEIQSEGPREAFRKVVDAWLGAEEEK